MPKVVTLESAPGEGLTVFSINRGDQVAGTVAIPVRDHLNAATVTSLVTSALSGGWVPAGQTVNMAICQGSILTLQRNELVQRLQGEWLLFIDDDMVWQPEQIGRLIRTREEHDLDMLGGLCFRRAHPHQPTLYMRERPTGGAYNFLEDWAADEIIEVDATGLAFAIIAKRVFEMITRLVEEDPDWTFPPYELRIGRMPPKYFTWNGDTGEDLRFCELAKAAGAHIWVDTANQIGHVSERSVGYRDFLTAIAERDQALEDARREVNTQMGFPTLSRAEALRRLGFVD